MHIEKRASRRSPPHSQLERRSAALFAWVQIRGVLAAGVLLCLALRILTTVRVNTTPSLPRGVYLLKGPRASGLRPGDLVMACPPPRAAALALSRHYLSRGGCPGGTKPLGKLVLAMAGDRLTLTAEAVTLGGCRLPASASRATDTLGRALSHPRAGEYRVTAGEVWVFSPHPRSFDSRTFGPVAAGAVVGRLRPLLLLPSEVDLPRWTALLRACAAAVTAAW
jgi:conjugative transfer signal peptidase TraF